MRDEQNGGKAQPKQQQELGCHLSSIGNATAPCTWRFVTRVVVHVLRAEEASFFCVDAGDPISVQPGQLSVGVVRHWAIRTLRAIPEWLKVCKNLIAGPRFAIAAERKDQKRDAKPPHEEHLHPLANRSAEAIGECRADTRWSVVAYLSGALGAWTWWSDEQSRL